MELATERMGGWPSGAIVLWTYTDPVTGSNGTSNIQRDYIAPTELDPLGADVTNPPPPPDPFSYQPPSYLEPVKQTYYQIEGGPTADHGVDGWYLNMVNKDFDAWNAQRYWNHGFRDWAMEIVANNPNVGVLSKDNDGHGNVKISLRWGQNAAAFLFGIDRQIQAGELVEAGGYGEVVGYEIGDPQNSGDHEFAHSQVRCPPTADQLLIDSKVKATLKEALTRGLKLRLEHGGWIYWNRNTGKLFTIIKQPTIDPLNVSGKADRWDAVYLDSPPSPPKGTVIVGQFHVHLEPLGPSGDFDDAAADQFKTPGIHMDSAGRMSTYGNYKRGIWNTDLPPGCR